MNEMIKELRDELEKVTMEIALGGVNPHKIGMATGIEKALNIVSCYTIKAVRE